MDKELGVLKARRKGYNDRAEKDAYQALIKTNEKVDSSMDLLLKQRRTNHSKWIPWIEYLERMVFLHGERSEWKDKLERETKKIKDGLKMMWKNFK